MKQIADFIEVGRTSELIHRTMKRVYMKSKDTLLARVDGKYYLVVGRYPHMGGWFYQEANSGEVWLPVLRTDNSLISRMLGLCGKSAIQWAIDFTSLGVSISWRHCFAVGL